MTDVFQALADPNRRKLLDRLFTVNGQSLGQLARDMPMSRQGVAKHLGVLEDASLISVRWQGREKRHYLNPVPIAEIVRRWVGKFEDARLQAMTDFKQALEQQEKRRA